MARAEIDSWRERLSTLSRQDLLGIASAALVANSALATGTGEADATSDAEVTHRRRMRRNERRLLRRMSNLSVAQAGACSVDESRLLALGADVLCNVARHVHQDSQLPLALCCTAGFDSVRAALGLSRSAGGPGRLMTRVGSIIGRTPAYTEWALSVGCPAASAVSAAARAGDLDAVMWLRRRGCPWTAGAERAAAEQDMFHVLLWAERTGCLQTRARALYDMKEARHTPDTAHLTAT